MGDGAGEVAGRPGATVAGVRIGPALFPLADTYATELPELCEPWEPRPVADPSLVVLNNALATALGGDPDELASPAGVAVLAGNAVPAGATPVALAYAGHQFGGYSPRLGDGRALLLGEVLDPTGERHDLHLKGSGRTPFARGGDGRAALGPMLREYLMGEAMAALGVPTTRMLAVVATGEAVAREVPLPGAVLTRVAASHIRVGTFQYAAAHPDPDVVRRLADYTIARHHPHAADAQNPYLALLEAVADVQADLIAQWMGIGFIHGVLNTDNVSVAGETIDYGPCAFMDTYDPATVFSSIDQGGRYAYGNQPAITQWNLARLAEALLGLLDDSTDTAVELATGVLHRFTDRYDAAWRAVLTTKLGLDLATVPTEVAGDLIDEVPGLLRANRVDWTRFFASLAGAADGDDRGLRDCFGDPDAPGPWLGRWSQALSTAGTAPGGIASALAARNPVYVPRNHLVEEALTAATAGDLSAFHDLLDVLAEPFTRRPGRERYELGAPGDFGPYQTFCGT